MTRQARVGIPGSRDCKSASDLLFFKTTLTTSAPRLHVNFNIACTQLVSTWDHECRVGKTANLTDVITVHVVVRIDFENQLV